MNHVHEPIKEHHVAQRHFDRLGMLSDGVFAIAMTLAAIEIKPDMQPGQSLLDAWTMPLLVYFLCFFLIGQLWVMHRRVVAQMRYFDGTSTVINLVLLSLVALLPVAIRFALSGQPLIVMMLVYTLAVAITYSCMAVFWGYIAFVAHLAPDLDVRQARVWLFKKIGIATAFAAVACYFAGSVVGAVAFVLAFVVLRSSIWGIERSLRQKA
jgi:uncharacterized membrane protein